MTKFNKNEKGIAMITLVVTVMLLIIITGVMVFNSHTSLQISNLTKLQNDIEALDNRIAAYYVQYGELPLYKKDNSNYVYTKSSVASAITPLDNNDGDKYYIIDISAIDNITLNYGSEWRSNEASDKYIINEQSHTIYYVKGVIYQGVRYHSIGLGVIPK